MWHSALWPLDNTAMHAAQPQRNYYQPRNNSISWSAKNWEVFSTVVNRGISNTSFITKALNDAVTPKQDWAEDCLVGLTVMLRAAVDIIKTCKNQNGKAAGARTMRNDGKCNATLRLANTNGRTLPQDESPLIP